MTFFLGFSVPLAIATSSDTYVGLVVTNHGECMGMKRVTGEAYVFVLISFIRSAPDEGASAR